MDPMQNYHLKHEIITVCQVDYRLCSLLDNQQYDKDDHQSLAKGITSSTWSLFGIVWPAAQILAAEVCGIDLAGKRVLEIGCGIGLASIVLHKKGVDITASDYHPRAKEFLDRNVLNNDLSPIKFQSVDFENINSDLGIFDLIIASDVLYQPHHAQCLATLIESHSSNDVNVIVVDPGRENRARFTHNMIARGYSHRFNRFNQQLGPKIKCKGRILHYHRQRCPVQDDIDNPETKQASVFRMHTRSMTTMQASQEIKIVGIDDERPPQVRKEAYIDLFFNLSIKAPMDWCEDFNVLGRQLDPGVKINKNSGICIEAWVRNMNDISLHLEKIKQKIVDCNEQYSEKARQKKLALLAAKTSTSSKDSEQFKLNQIIADLNY